MRNFKIYGTCGCHLCEIALAMLQEVRRAGGEAYAVEEVDISEVDDLFVRYGLRIPVVAHPDGSELDWPFSEQQLLAFVSG